MTFTPPSRFELPFAAFVAYCPRGDGEPHETSRKLVRQVKENRIVRGHPVNESCAAFVARRLGEERPAVVVSMLRPDAVLVPVPRSSLTQPGALWPSLEICNALVARGFGGRVLACLRRDKAVPKAARAGMGERPSAATNFRSLAVDRPLDVPAEVVLVDDVVTRGATLVGASWRLMQARPGVVVRAFAVIRTISRPDRFARILDPCAGTIVFDGGNYERTP